MFPCPLDGLAVCRLLSSITHLIKDTDTGVSLGAWVAGTAGGHVNPVVWHPP